MLTQSMADALFLTLGKAMFKRTGLQFFLEDKSSPPSATGGGAKLTTRSGSMEREHSTAAAPQDSSSRMRASTVNCAPEWVGREVWGQQTGQSQAQKMVKASQRRSRLQRPLPLLGTFADGGRAYDSSSVANRGAKGAARPGVVPDVGQNAPLLARIAFDVPGEGCYYSALQVRIQLSGSVTILHLGKELETG